MTAKIFEIIAPPVPRIELYLGAILLGVALKAFRGRANQPFDMAELKPQNFEPYWETLK